MVAPEERLGTSELHSTKRFQRPSLLRRLAATLRGMSVTKFYDRTLSCSILPSHLLLGPPSSPQQTTRRTRGEIMEKRHSATKGGGGG